MGYFSLTLPKLSYTHETYSMFLFVHKPYLILFSHTAYLNQHIYNIPILCFCRTLLCNQSHSNQTYIKIISNDFYLQQSIGHLRPITQQVNKQLQLNIFPRLPCYVPHKIITRCDVIKTANKIFSESAFSDSYYRVKLYNLISEVIQ